MIGAGRLIRLLHDCITMPMTREALTASVIAPIRDLPGGTSEGEAVFMETRDGCLGNRGVRSDLQAPISATLPHRRDWSTAA